MSLCGRAGTEASTTRAGSLADCLGLALRSAEFGPRGLTTIHDPLAVRHPTMARASPVQIDSLFKYRDCKTAAAQAAASAQEAGDPRLRIHQSRGEEPSLEKYPLWTMGNDFAAAKLATI